MTCDNKLYATLNINVTFLRDRKSIFYVREIKGENIQVSINSVLWRRMPVHLYHVVILAIKIKPSGISFKMYLQIFGNGRHFNKGNREVNNSSGKLISTNSILYNICSMLCYAYSYQITTANQSLFDYILLE